MAKDKNMVVTGRLENWIYDPRLRVFWGNIYGDVHKRFTDGIWIHTSHCPFPEAQEDDLVNTLNSVYRLGKPQVG
jgi:hypothetical protein